MELETQVPLLSPEVWEERLVLHQLQPLLLQLPQLEYVEQSTFGQEKGLVETVTLALAVTMLRPYGMHVPALEPCAVG